MRSISPVVDIVMDLFIGIYIAYLDWNIARMDHKPENARYILRRNRIAQGRLF
jgi:hypothetical protein